MRGFNKVFNIGLNKTGTKSLSVALRGLGFKTVHFKYRERRLVDIIRSNYRSGKMLLSGMEQFDAFSDFAGEYFFKELDRQYPGSRFILTIREVDDWLESRERHVLRNRGNPRYQYVFREVNKEQWRLHMDRTLRLTRAFFKNRPRDLLIMNIPGGEGWEKLCPFLDVQAPEGPFPFENR